MVATYIKRGSQVNVLTITVYNEYVLKQNKNENRRTTIWIKTTEMTTDWQGSCLTDAIKMYIQKPICPSSEIYHNVTDSYWKYRQKHKGNECTQCNVKTLIVDLFFVSILLFIIITVFKILVSNKTVPIRKNVWPMLFSVLHYILQAT